MPVTEILFFTTIPIVNGVGNVLLKRSLEQRACGNRRLFLIMQLFGYSTFVAVSILTYLFLVEHSANLFILVFALNYLATQYLSRYLLGEKFGRRNMAFDVLIVIGGAIFLLGQQ